MCKHREGEKMYLSKNMKKIWERQQRNNMKHEDIIFHIDRNIPTLNGFMAATRITPNRFGSYTFFLSFSLPLSLCGFLLFTDKHSE